MSKHTPGPWRLHPVDDTQVIDADEREVAAIDGDYNQPDTWPQMEANARLIAAAPDMLEALRDLYNYARCWPGEDGSRFHCLLEQATAAIARATGEAP